MYDCKEALRRIDAVIAQGPYTDTWESLSNWQPPEWYRNAKFGIFIHWGVYSVPAFENEWYPRNMYIEGSKVFEHHAKTYGAHKDFGYKDFIPLFKAEKFDPAAWAALFKRAGARYVVPVAEHHDGFQMYKSALSHWNAAEMGPQRDIVGALKDAVEAEGMTLGVSSHRIEHWFFMGGGKNFESDIPQNPDRDDLYWPSMASPENTDDLFGAPGPDAEFLDDWLVRTCELIDSYRPRILYFDWWIQHANAKPYLKRLAAYYYNRAAEWGVEVAIDYKHDAFLFGTAVPDIERGQMADIKPYFWQTDTAIALNSWCYTENNDFRPAEDILCDLVDIVSKNGCLLLNVGRHDLRRGHGGADGDRRLDGGQRRGDLRHACVEDVRRGSDEGAGRPFFRRGQEELHERGFPLHGEGRQAVRRSDEGERKRRILHPLAAHAGAHGRHGVPRPRRARRGAGDGCGAGMDARRGGPAHPHAVLYEGPGRFPHHAELRGAGACKKRFSGRFSAWRPAWR